MSVAFDGMGSVVVTFQANSATAGKPASMAGNNMVANASGGVAPVGIILNRRGNHAAVQIQGYTQVKYSAATTPSLGWNQLVTDGTGGLRLAASGETGRACLVVNRDTENKTMGLFL